MTRIETADVVRNAAVRHQISGQQWKAALAGGTYGGTFTENAYGWDSSVAIFFTRNGVSACTGRKFPLQMQEDNSKAHQFPES